MTTIEDLIRKIDELLEQFGTGEGINPPYEPTPKSVRDFYTVHPHITDNKIATISGMFGLADPTKDRPAKFIPLKITDKGKLMVESDLSLGGGEGEEEPPLHIVFDELRQHSINNDFEEEVNREWIGGKWTTFGEEPKIDGDVIYNDDNLIPNVTSIPTSATPIYIFNDSSVAHNLSKNALVFDYTQGKDNEGFVVVSRTKKAIATGVPIRLEALVGVVNEDGVEMPELIDNPKFSIGFMVYDQHDNPIERIDTTEYGSLYRYAYLKPCLPSGVDTDIFVASPQPPEFTNVSAVYIPPSHHAGHYVRPFISCPQISDINPDNVGIFFDQIRLIRGNIFEPIFKRYIAGDRTQYEDIDEQEDNEKVVELAFGNGITLMVESEDDATDLYWALSHDRETWIYPDEYHFQTAVNPDGFGVSGNAYAMVNVEYRAKWLKIFTSSQAGHSSDVRIALVETQEE